MTRSPRAATPIAIVGIGCRFPGGVRDAASYWNLMIRARCAIREIPPERWSLEGFYDPRPDIPDRSYSKWGGFLDDVRGFDPSYFGLSPREAEAMDPQQRLMLMAVCEAAQDARLPLAALRAKPTGVFIGVSNVDYGLVQHYRPGHGETQAGTGTALSIVANRVSNRLDLSGPSMGVDTACSSALVAIDTACRHLGDGSCDMALAGGVNILLDPRMFITFSRAHMLSPSGRIRAFDAAADGFVRGEGVGVVLLRRLDDALAGGDHIYAVIEATAINQDGRTGTITEPNAEAQIAMMRAAMERAQREPGDIAYVEAHGTGTPVGDPIEARAIGTVLGRKRAAALPIGSVKTNIGHLEPAAGIAGLIKAALVLHHGIIPPSLGFERSNPSIGLDELGLTVARQVAPLAEGREGSSVLVNSFGFGGTNACAVLRSVARSQKPRSVAAKSEADETRAFPVPLSGPTPRHLEAFAARLVREIDDGAFAGHSLAHIAAALAGQRDHHEHRAVIIASTVPELRERLACLADDREWPQPERHAPPKIIRGKARVAPKLVLTMTGQGGQWWAMGRELMQREPVFRATFEAFDRVFRPAAGWSVIAELLADEAASRIDDAAITPAVMFAFQAGLAEVWRACGVVPDIVLGHSFGEVTAAYLAGGIGMADVARLVTHRGLIRGHVERTGTMAAIGLGAEAIAPLLPADGRIEIGGYNSPGMVTLTGEEAAIDALITRLNADDPTILTRKLALDFAYHSSWFAPVEHIFKADVGTLSRSAPNLPVISTVTGELNQDFSTDYWWRNLRQPVLYQKGIETALDLGGEVFLELGPHRTLSSMTAACAAAKGRDVATVSTLDRRWSDLVSLAVATGQLYVSGVAIDWSAVHGGTGRDVALPSQPWLLRDLWSEPEEAGRHLRPAVAHPLLGRSEPGPTQGWLSNISLETHAWLGDHRLDGECVMPAAAYIEMLVVAARAVLGVDAIELVDVAFPVALYIGADDEIVLATRYEPTRRLLSIHSRLRGSMDWQLHAEAKVFAFEGDVAEPAVEASGQSVLLDAATFYRNANVAGYGWGRHFQGLTKIQQDKDAVRGEIAVPPLQSISPFAFDPRALDSALQLMLATTASGEIANVVPAGIDRVVALGTLEPEATAHAATSIDAVNGDLLASVSVSRPGEAPTLRIEGLRAKRRVRATAMESPQAFAPRFLVETFEPLHLAFDAPAYQGEFLVLVGADCASATQLAAVLRKRGLTVEPRTVHVHEAGERRAYLDAIRAALEDHTLAGIIYAMPLTTSQAGAADIATTAQTHALNAIAFGRAIAELASTRTPPPILVLTHGARTLDDGEGMSDAGLAQSPVLAIARTIAMEVPQADIRLIDVDAASLSQCDAWLALLTRETRETEIVLRDGKAFVPRLRAQDPEQMKRRRTLAEKLGRDINFALRRDGAIGAEGLVWRETAMPPIGDSDVRVEVAAAGLNFRDVMAVAGLLPEQAEPTPAIDALGLELSGVVVACGANVRDLTIGDRVFGMGRSALQRYVTWPRAALHRVPTGVSLDDAAAMPSAYLTAHYALNVIGRLAPGETVLIHSAAGGVGLAAIALANSVGARIIATAGTLEKRAHLTSFGVSHVFDSRSLGFADDVLRATSGRGADVVLNSLGGPFIDKSLSCLAPYGRFLELGKRDVYGDSALGLKSLRANISFHVIDLAALIADRPQQAARMMDEVLAMLAANTIAPLPVSTFAASAIRDAFTHFASARHIGKVVVNLDDTGVEVERAVAKGAPLDRNGTYLVTGGIHGFGRAIGQWLAAQGAGRVVLASRGATREADADASIETLHLDVTDSAAVERTVAVLANAPKPLRGIVHAAVVYDDAMLDHMTPARARRVMAPKIDGAINLTRAVEHTGTKLDFFVSCSSLAQVTGWPGQANYAAANGFLEAFAHWQRGRGIPGLCINWGALGESGHVARSVEMQAYLDSAGWKTLGNATALPALAKALDSDRTSITFAAADWRQLAATHPALARSARVAGLTTARAETNDTQTVLAGLKGDALQMAALRLVHAQTAKVLRTDPAELLGVQTLDDAGIDSLSSFELRNRLGQALGQDVPMARFAKAHRFDDLAALVATLVSGSPA